MAYWNLYQRRGVFGQALPQRGHVKILNLSCPNKHLFTLVFQRPTDMYAAVMKSYIVKCPVCGKETFFSIPTGFEPVRMQVDVTTYSQMSPEKQAEFVSIGKSVWGSKKPPEIFPVAPPEVTPEVPPLKPVTLEQQLSSIQQKIIEKQQQIEQLKREIQELEAKAGMTPEDKARLTDLDKKIVGLQEEIKRKEEAILLLRSEVEEKEKQQADLLAEQNSINTQIRTWQERLRAAQALKTKWLGIIPENPPEGSWKFPWGLATVTDPAKFASSVSSYLDPELSNCKRIWQGQAEIESLPGSRWYSYRDSQGRRRSSVVMRPTPRIKIPAIGYDSGEPKYRSDMEKALDNLIYYAQERISSLQNKLRDVIFSLDTVGGELISLRGELSSAEYDLEATKRLLEDARSAKARAELEIRRAIALRQAEFDAAKQRYELELRLLEQLKATEEMLKAQIEAAKQQAILEAAKQREEVLKAEEEKRLEVAQQIREEAEKKVALAEAESVIATKERQEFMEEAYKAASRAKSEAEQMAKEREDIAKQIAQAQANLQAKRTELEQLQTKVRQLGVEVAEREEIPWGMLILLGIGLFLGGKKPGAGPAKTERGKYIKSKLEL